jgi:hypothetical protein
MYGNVPADYVRRCREHDRRGNEIDKWLPYLFNSLLTCDQKAWFQIQIIFPITYKLFPIPDFYSCFNPCDLSTP